MYFSQSFPTKFDALEPPVEVVDHLCFEHHYVACLGESEDLGSQAGRCMIAAPEFMRSAGDKGESVLLDSGFRQVPLTSALAASSRHRALRADCRHPSALRLAEVVVRVAQHRPGSRSLPFAEYDPRRDFEAARQSEVIMPIGLFVLGKSRPESIGTDTGVFYQRFIDTFTELFLGFSGADGVGAGGPTKKGFACALKCPTKTLVDWVVLFHAPKPLSSHLNIDPGLTNLKSDTSVFTPISA